MGIKSQIETNDFSLVQEEWMRGNYEIWILDSQNIKEAKVRTINGDMIVDCRQIQRRGSDERYVIERYT